MQQLDLLGETGLAQAMSKLANGVFEGEIHVVAGLPGVVCWYLQGHQLVDLSITMKMDLGLSIQFVQSARGQRKVASQRSQAFNSGHFFLSCFPDGVQQTRNFEKGAPLRYVGIWIAPDILVENYLDPEYSKTGQIGAFLRGELAAPIDFQGLLSVRMQNCIDDLFSKDFSGNLARSFVKGKVNELICSAVSYLNPGNFSPNQMASDSSRVLQQSLKVQRAADILEASLEQPPSCRLLASKVSLGHNKFRILFQETYGCTVHQYSKRCRMKHAAELIKDSRHSMIEISHMSGFNCQSSFSRAFREYFGCRPSAFKPGDEGKQESAHSKVVARP